MNFVDKSQQRNPAGIAVIVALHLLAALIAVKGSTVLVSHAPASIVELLPEREIPPPLLPPESVPMPDAVPPPTTTIAVPEIPFDVTPPTNATPMATRPASDPTPPAMTGAGDPGPTPLQPPTQKAGPMRVDPVVDAKACTRPEYPRGALRNGDTGTVTLALLVGADGKVVESRVEKSSGFRELDRAAQAGLALCRFKPGTVDGVAYQSWARMEYLWSLDD